MGEVDSGCRTRGQWFYREGRSSSEQGGLTEPAQWQIVDLPIALFVLEPLQIDLGCGELRQRTAFYQGELLPSCLIVMRGSLDLGVST